MPPSSFFPDNENVLLQNYTFWLPKPSWGPENGQNRLPGSSRGPPKWSKSSPRGPPKAPTITLRTLQGPPRGQLDASEALQVSLGSDFGSPADPAEPSKPYRFLKENIKFRVWTRCGPKTRPDPVPDPGEGARGAKVLQVAAGAPPRG